MRDRVVTLHFKHADGTQFSDQYRGFNSMEEAEGFGHICASDYSACGMGPVYLTAVVMDPVNFIMIGLKSSGMYYKVERIS